MAASQHSVPSSLAGLPPILDPAPGASGCTGLASQPAGVDADIRALLGAFPTKVDMEALVLRVEEQHRRDFQQIRAEVGGLDDRLTRGEASVSVLEARVAQMEQAHSLYQDQLAEVQLHAEDLENRSRRNNLRLWGLPEATGPENLLETVRSIFLGILDLTPPATLEFDRVHRVLGPKPADQDRPRDVICRVHRYAQKELILRAAWQKDPIDFAGASVSVFPDVSWATLQRRAMLKPLLETLRRADLPYRWGFPLQLTDRTVH